MTYPCHTHGKKSGGSHHSHWRGVHGYNKIVGTTTVGERGQAVIPREAREALGLESGDKLVVFCNESRGSVTLVKADVFEDFADIIMAKSKKLEKVANAVWEAVYDEEYVEGEDGERENADEETEKAPADDETQQ